MGGRLVFVCLLSACGSVGGGGNQQVRPDAAPEPDATQQTPMSTLTITKSGAGGLITSNPAGVDCGVNCSVSVPTGSQVELTATPDTGNKFDGWTDNGCTGTAPCTLTVNADTTVAAAFSVNNCTGSVTINYTGAMTTYTTPSCATSVTIEAYGASGGNASAVLGGLGARMKGTFAIAGGTQLKVLVGGRGIDASGVSMDGGASGGGGTFVALMNNTALLVAGGGGGACYITSGGTGNSPGLGGVTTNNGTAGNDVNTAQGCTTAPCYPGGTSAGGGTSSAWTGWHGGAGGGGFTGDGINATSGSTSFGTANQPGKAFVNGGAGGAAGTQTGAHPGGFGGGGSAGSSGGGGGGYSGGGAGGDYNYGGGGGGSFNSGASQSNTAATNSGNGKVVITW